MSRRPSHRRRPGRRPPARFKGSVETGRPGGFTGHGFGPAWKLILPGLEGPAKKRVLQPGQRRERRGRGGLRRGLRPDRPGPAGGDPGPGRGGRGRGVDRPIEPVPSRMIAGGGRPARPPTPAFRLVISRGRARSEIETDVPRRGRYGPFALPAAAGPRPTPDRADRRGPLTVVGQGWFGAEGWPRQDDPSLRIPPPVETPSGGACGISRFAMVELTIGSGTSAIMHSRYRGPEHVISSART